MCFVIKNVKRVVLIGALHAQLSTIPNPQNKLKFALESTMEIMRPKIILKAL